MARHATALLALVLTTAACGGVAPKPPTPVAPTRPAWKTLLGEFVTPPLAADSRRLFVATQDGSVRALDAATGAVIWRVEGLPGTISATDGTLLVRGSDGRLTSLQPRTGGVRWTASTGIRGALAVLIDEDRATVAGMGLTSLDLATGRVLWSEPASPEVTAPVVRAGDRLLIGETDGTLRCRDRSTGVSRWTLRTRRALLAAPVVDAARGRLYLGTTQKRILAVDIRDGSPGWRWTVGADVASTGLLLEEQVLFAALDAVLYALRPGGNLAWRAPLPSRPLSGPLLVAGNVLVPCLENEILAFSPSTGAPLGRLTTTAEIRTAPLVAAQHLVLGLRDRSVIAFALPGAADAPSAPPLPAAEPTPTSPSRPAPLAAPTTPPSR